MMKLHEIDLFSPHMTEFDLTEIFWSAKDTMTSSVKIFKKNICYVIAIRVTVYDQKQFYNDSGLLSFNFMHHVTIMKCFVSNNIEFQHYEMCRY